MKLKNFTELINEFVAGATDERVGNLKINGNLLIHYETTIAERNDEKFIINNTRYSLQTGRVQKLLKSSIPPELIQEVTKIPRGHRQSLHGFLTYTW